MFTEQSESMIKEILKSLCCSNGWSYGVLWGFDQANSLLLTLKDAYYEEQMGALIDGMLLQVHVLGGGVIGQVAFTKSHQWMHSDAYHERQNYVGSFESLEALQDDSEFYCQFSMGIKTIALISVEHWGVIQLGSTHNNPESKEFVDQVKELLRGTDRYQEINFLENEAPSDNQLFSSSMEFGYLNSHGAMEANDSLILPSQSFSSASDNADQWEQLLLDPANNFFDCSAIQSLSKNNGDFSVLFPSWAAHSTSGLEENVCLSKPASYEQSTKNSTDFKSQRTCGLLTLDELLEESKVISKCGLEGDLSQWYLSNDLPTNSTQSCVTDALRLDQEVKCSNPAKNPMGWSETLIPVGNGDDLNFSKSRTSNSLFSKLGLDQILDGIATGSSSTSFAKSRFDDQSSSAAKRRKVDNHSWSHSQVKTETRSIGLSCEASTRETGSCIGDSYSIDGGNTSSSKTITGKKKKAKPGTRPRPKDRQMIQDRLAELRELIPNGEKVSIDRLLERTIRHLNFMQSLTKRAECLKGIDKPKNGVVTKTNSSNCGGVTWACEVGDQNMICPLRVEDLANPGQMLIEMICEEQGFFLEILDIIQGFGLIVLKGVMEACETKIWAHFIVEAEGSRRVTRHEIFSSLIQLLQMTGESAADANDKFSDVIIRSHAPPPFNTYQPAVSFPVNLADTLQCANL